MSVNRIAHDHAALGLVPRNAEVIATVDDTLTIVRTLVPGWLTDRAVERNAPRLAARCRSSGCAASMT